MSSIAVTRPVTTDSIEEVLSLLENVLCTAKATELETFQVMTCCREALNNIVEHSGQQTFGFSVRVFPDKERHQMVIGFAHTGQFDRPKVSATMPVDTVSGRGWPIIEAWMDDVQLQHSSRATYLFLIKHLESSSKNRTTTKAHPSVLTPGDGLNSSRRKK